MKKIFLMLLFLFYLNNVFSVSLVDLWTRRYRNAKDIKEKREIVLSLNKRVTGEYEPLILEILKEMSLYIPDASPENFRYYEDIVYYVAEMMQKLGIKKSSDDLILIYKKMKNPLHKGMIAETIGMIQDKKDLWFLNEELKLINLEHRKGTYKDKDRQLYGIVRGLQFFSDPSSFSELFYVAIPNYSKVIQEEANKAILKITKDVAPYCKELIESETDARIILEALSFAYSSESSVEKKVECAQVALLKGINFGLKDPVVNTQFEKIRDESTRILGELKASDEKTLVLISKKWDNDKNTNSRLITIEALEKIGTNESGKILANWLKIFIDRKKKESAAATTIPDENKILIAIIKALGNIKGDVGAEELFEITPIFGSIIVDEARKALEKKGFSLN